MKEVEIKPACDEARFLRDVQDHGIEIIRDDGIHRHIQFRKGNSYIYGFDLITWPGFLCIAGDCGTYVFQRTEDMFGFFRTGEKYKKENLETKLFINSGYWGEKLQSISQNGGYREFNEDEFRNQVIYYFNSYWEGRGRWEVEGPEQHWHAIEDCILGRHVGAIYELEAYEAVSAFKWRDFEFTDFFDGGGTESYTFRYLWNLYAIVWGIEKYDKYKLTLAKKMKQDRRLQQAQGVYASGLQKVADTSEPKGQKFPNGSRVRIGKMPSFMSHFKGECDATVEYTYAHAYGGDDVKSYCLDIDGHGVVAWYKEQQLTEIVK